MNTRTNTVKVLTKSTLKSIRDLPSFTDKIDYLKKLKPALTPPVRASKILSMLTNFEKKQKSLMLQNGRANEAIDILYNIIAGNNTV